MRCCWQVTLVSLRYTQSTLKYVQKPGVQSKQEVYNNYVLQESQRGEGSS